MWILWRFGRCNESSLYFQWSWTKSYFKQHTQHHCTFNMYIDILCDSVVSARRVWLVLFLCTEGGQKKLMRSRQCVGASVCLLPPHLVSIQPHWSMFHHYLWMFGLLPTYSRGSCILFPYSHCVEVFTYYIYAKGLGSIEAYSSCKFLEMSSNVRRFNGWDDKWWRWVNCTFLVSSGFSS